MCFAFGFNILTLTFKNSLFPKTFTDSSIFRIIKLSISLSLAIVIIASINRSISPFELSISILKSMLKIACINAFWRGKYAFPIIQIILKGSLINIALVILHNALPSIAILKNALKKQIICLFLTISMPSIILKGASILSIVGPKVAITIRPSKPNVSLIKISILHDKPASPMWYSLQKRSLIIATIRIVVTSPATWFSILNYEEFTFHSPRQMIPVLRKLKYPSYYSPRSTNRLPYIRYSSRINGYVRSYYMRCFTG